MTRRLCGFGADRSVPRVRLIAAFRSLTGRVELDGLPRMATIVTELSQTAGELLLLLTHFIVELTTISRTISIDKVLLLIIVEC